MSFCMPFKLHGRLKLIQGVPCIVSLRTEAVEQKNHASCVASHDSCRNQKHSEVL